MSDFETILWNRNKELMDEIVILNRGLAKVLISGSLEESRSAAKEAFATIALTDPFAHNEPEKVTEEVAA